MSTTQLAGAAPRPIRTSQEFLAASPQAALDWFRAIGPDRTRIFYKEVLMSSTGLPDSVEAVRFHQSRVRRTEGLAANLRRATSIPGKELLTR